MRKNAAPQSGPLEPTLRELFAFVTVDPDKDVETIVYMRDIANYTPLVTDDRDAVERLKPIARRIATDRHHEVKLIRFTQREELPL